MGKFSGGVSRTTERKKVKQRMGERVRMTVRHTIDYVSMVNFGELVFKDVWKGGRGNYVRVCEIEGLLGPLAAIAVFRRKRRAYHLNDIYLQQLQIVWQIRLIVTELIGNN
jgi:hypothetical protein